MSKYEIAIVLSAKLEDEERAAALEKIRAYIGTYGGTIVKEDDWGKVMVADRFENSLDARFGRLLNEEVHVEDAVAEAFSGTLPRRLF